MDRWMIFGTEVRMPVEIRDAAIASAVFTCPGADAADVLGESGLTPFTVGHRAVTMLACIRYRNGDLGAYDEVGLGVIAWGPTGGLGLYTVELPVTGEFTLHAGRQIWGLPKWRARMEATFGERRTHLRLWDGDERVLAVAFDGGPARLPLKIPAPMPTWAVRPDGPDVGQLLRGGVALNLVRPRIRPGGARVALGEHRMAELARRLGVTGTAVATITASRSSGSIGDWDPVDPGVPATRRRWPRGPDARSRSA